jgi:putative ABC transport system substrate-binding protein
MDRRRFVSGAVIAVFVAPLPADAQLAMTTPRIGFLTPGVAAAIEDAFWTELRRLGYVEGKNIVVEHRSAHGEFERLPGLAAELVSLKVDIIVAVVTQAALAAKQATATIPIVMVGVSDPVASGLVTNLARPGSNITGTSGVGADVVAKQLELLRTLLPNAARVTALWNPGNRTFQQQQLNEAMAAAPKLRLQLQLMEARSADDLDRAFAAIGKDRPDALLVLADPMFGSHAKQIAGLALKHHLPAAAGTRLFAQSGILATYGVSLPEGFRRAAAYVDKILKGAKPGDLPVEQPTKLELVINLKTAKALGVTIPQPLLLRADEVIQ